MTKDNAELIAEARKRSRLLVEGRLLDDLADALEAGDAAHDAALAVIEGLREALEAVRAEHDAALAVIAEAIARYRALNDGDYVADEMLAILDKATS